MISGERYSSLSFPETSPVVRRAISQSKRRSRQIWIIWVGGRIALRNAYQLGRGTLIARIIGDEVFLSDALQGA